MALTPQDEAEILARRQELMRQFALGRSQSQYDRGIFDQNYQQQQRDLALRLAAARDDTRGNLMARGIFGSGIANQDFSEIATAGQRERGDLSQAYAQGQGQFSLRDAQLEQDLQAGLQNIDTERFAREAAIAAQIAAATQAPTVQPPTGAQSYAPTPGAPPASAPLRNAPAPRTPTPTAPRPGLVGGGKAPAPPRAPRRPSISGTRRNF